MKTAVAIITSRSVRTCHAVILARELGTAAVVGTEHASKLRKDGGLVTVSCAEGASGKVMRAKLPSTRM